MPEQPSFRQRFPGPWAIEETPSGYKVAAKCGTAIAYVYCYTDSWQSGATTGTKKLSRAEGLAAAKAIAGLAEGGGYIPSLVSSFELHNMI